MGKESPNENNFNMTGVKTGEYLNISAVVCDHQSLIL